MKSKIAFAIFIVLVVFGGLAGTKALQIRKLMAAGKSFSQPPETVSAIVAKEEKWQETLTAIGSIVAVQGVMVTPEIAGTVREIAFESGAIVAKDDLLVRLDISSEEAQLRSLEAQTDLAKLNLDRMSNLRKESTVSQSDLDTADAAFKQNQANADNLRAIIAKKTLRAPFAGQVGIRQINQGQYVDAGKPVVSLQALDPVYANFSLPQQDMGLLKTGMCVRLRTDAYAGRTFEGKLTAINPDLDSSTRSVTLQATYTNADRSLRPGMFCKVEVVLPEEHSVLVIPATALLSVPYGDSVYVIEAASGKDGKNGQVVRQQFVKAGRTRGDFVTIETGLKPNERIVSSGLFKLRNGMPVAESNAMSPKSEQNPVLPDN
jgi:membrane fusion protein (multidrug efflux system)